MSILKLIIPLSLITASAFLFSCGSRGSRVPDISGIEAEVHISRFDSILGSVHLDSIPFQVAGWKKEFAYILDNPMPDSILASSISEFIDEPLIREAMRRSHDLFADTREMEGAFSQAFRYMKYYFPDTGIPIVYTYISGFDTRYPIKYSDTAMAIGLDLYLGDGFIAYRNLGIPAYQQRWMVQGAMLRDVMAEIYMARFHSLNADPTLLDHMIERGKQLVFISSTLPSLHDSLVLKYTGRQMEWCDENETGIWSFFIEQNLLFSRDHQKTGRFIQPGPFTQGMGEQSPGRLADITGYRIIRSFLNKNPDISLSELFAMKDPEKVLRMSAYKPRR